MKQEQNNSDWLHWVQRLQAIAQTGLTYGTGTYLLVQERADGNHWTLPGGWVDVGDSPATAVTREISEESGYHTRPLKLAACFDRNNHPHPPIIFHTFKLFFLCELLGGEPTSSLETAGSAFFRRDEIPVDNLSLSRVTPGQIEMLFTHHANPGLPTEFD